MSDYYKKSLTQGNRLDVKNLASLLQAISDVASSFAKELMPYSTKEDSRQRSLNCFDCIRRCKSEE